MVCARCSAENSDTTRFCGQCGNLLVREAAPTIADTQADIRRSQAQTVVGISNAPLDSPSFALTGGAPAGFTAAAFTPGTAFGTRYRIEGLLGEGGMGAVYKAYDAELDRFVALKIVRPELATSSQTMARFKQELLLASRISQKNVLRIHDLGDSNGIKFISMAFVEGTDLAGLIDKTGRLPLDLALKYTRQLCAALEAAHAEGVVHRDLKPQNILIDKSETLYVSDFGLAKSLAATAAGMTRTGQVLGTPLYMSPEQVEAVDVDHRSDLYSLGLIIFEMYTADLPFRGTSAMQVMYQRVNSEPGDPRKLRPDMPEFIAKIILKCLAREQAKRYQSAREILNDLDAQIAPVLPSRPGTATISIGIPVPTRRVGIISSGVAVAVLAGVFSIPVTRHAVLSVLPGAAQRGNPAIQHYLAVMPLSIAGDAATLKYVAQGVGDALSAKLSGLRNVYVAAGSTVGAAVAAQKTDDRIAKSLGVTILVKGNVQSSGDKISITITMDDLKTKKSLLNREFAGVRQDLLTIEDQIFNGIAETLRIRQSNEERARTTAHPTDNIDAYDLYLKGRNLLAGDRKKTNMEEALSLFNAAIAKDPSFALAYAGSADASVLLWEQTKDGLLMQQALGAAEQAARLKDNLPEVHFSLGNVYKNTGKTAEAIVELKRAQQLAPNSDDAWRRLGMAYRAAGQPDLAVAAGNEATRVNPYLWANYNSLGVTYYILGQNEKALQAYQKVTELAPETPTGWANLGATYYRMAKWSDCIPAFQKAIELDPKPFYYSQLGVTYFFLGKYAEAAKMFETAVAKDPSALFEVNLADAYRWSNQPDKAAATYDKAIELAYAALKVNPKNADALAYLATAYAKKGDQSNAATYIRQARQLQAGNNDYMYREATIRTLAGEFPEAVASMGEALRSGYSLEEAKVDPELKPLRERPEFVQLLKDLAAKPAR